MTCVRVITIQQKPKRWCVSLRTEFEQKCRCPVLRPCPQTQRGRCAPAVVSLRVMTPVRSFGFSAPAPPKKDTLQLAEVWSAGPVLAPRVIREPALMLFFLYTKTIIAARYPRYCSRCAVASISASSPPATQDTVMSKVPPHDNIPRISPRAI